jgi:hypothetical protein
MIIATKTREWTGNPNKGERRFDWYALVNFSTDADIDILGYKAGDVVENGLNVPFLTRGPQEMDRQINNWVVEFESLLASLIYRKNNPVTLPAVVDLSAYRKPTPVELSEEDKALQMAQRDYQQKLGALDLAKKELELGYITQDEFDAMKAEGAALRATMTTAKDAASVKLVAEKISG